MSTPPVPATSPFAPLSAPVTEASLAAAKAHGWESCPRPGFMHQGGIIVAVNQAASKIFGNVVGQSLGRFTRTSSPTRQFLATHPPQSGASLHVHTMFSPRFDSITASDTGSAGRSIDSGISGVQIFWLEERRSPDSPAGDLRLSPSGESITSERSSPQARRRGRFYAHGIGGEINKLQGDVAALEGILAKMVSGESRVQLESTIAGMKARLADLTRNYNAFYSVHSADIGDMEMEVEASTIQDTLLGSPVSDDPRLVVDCDQALASRFFSLDWNKIRYVVTQLVQNALKHDKSTNPVSLQISLSGTSLIFTVIDKGPGFSQIFLDDIMAERAAQSPHGSGGLKLTACKRLVTAMNGIFTATTELEIGSRFSFSLPVPAREIPRPFAVFGGEQVPIIDIRRIKPRALRARPAGRDPVQAALHSIGSSGSSDDAAVLFAGLNVREARHPASPGTVLTAESVAVPAKVKLAEARILVVDDELTARKILERMLKNCGFTNIECVTDGDEAVTKVKASTTGYTAILMDQQMPRMMGDDAAKEILAWQTANGKPKCPIISCSSNMGASDLAIYRTAGMEKAMIPKPVTKDSIVKALGNYVDLPAPKS